MTVRGLHNPVESMHKQPIFRKRQALGVACMVFCLLVTANIEAQAPLAPSNVSLQVLGPRKVLATWTDNATDETSYVVERSETPGGPTWLPSANLPADSVSYEDSQSLQGNTTYYYRVKAINGSGESSSSEVSTTTDDYPGPNQNPDGIGHFSFNLNLHFSPQTTSVITSLDDQELEAVKDGELVTIPAGKFWFKRQIPTSPPGATPIDEVDIYSKDGGGSWVYLGTISPPLTAGTTSQFGTSIVSEGDRIYIGAPGALNSSSVASGVVYVYSFDGTSVTLEQTLEPPNGALGDEFGFSQSVSREKLIVGAPGTDRDVGTIITDAGAVHYYEHDITWQYLRTEWGQTQQNNAGFGFSVCIRERIIAIGAPFEDITFHVNGNTYPTSDAGSVYLGLWNKPSQLARYDNLYWFYPAVQQAMHGLEGAHFGWSVSINEMMRVAVGMPDSSWQPEDNMNGWDAGLVMIMHWHGVIDSGMQLVVVAFTHDDLSAGDRFGEYIEAAPKGMDWGIQTGLRTNNVPIHYYALEPLLVQPGTLSGGVEQPWTIGDLFGVDPDDDPVTHHIPFIENVPGSHFDLVGPRTFASKSTLSQVANGLHPIWFGTSDDRGGTNRRQMMVEVTGASADIDGDGIPDWWETDNGLNPNDPSDGLLDPDGDGLTNYGEYAKGTALNIADTDGDGIADGQEVEEGSDPLNSNNSSLLAQLQIYTRLE